MARKNLFNIADADTGRPAFDPPATPEPQPAPRAPEAAAPAPASKPSQRQAYSGR
jgi:hypothetical protein